MNLSKPLPPPGKAIDPADARTPAAPERGTGVSQIDLADQAIRQMQQKEWEAAVATYAEICRSNPYSASHWFNYGYALHQTRRCEEAIRAWQKAIDLGFGYDNKLWPRGVFTEDWWRYFGPKINAPWYMIARAQSRLGRKAEAMRSLSRALDGGFNDPQALREEPDLAALRDDPKYQARFQVLAGIPPDGLSRDERWRFDLDYLARRIEQIHYAPFRSVSRRQFQRAIRTLKAEVPTLKEYEIAMRMRQIVAMIGDGHTTLFWSDALRDYPIFLYLYSDGLFVRQAPKPWAEAVGSRVISIGGHDAQAVLKAVEPFCSVDNAMDMKKQAPWRAANPSVLAALKLIRDEDMDRVPMVVQRRDGQRRTVELSRRIDGSGPWISINARAHTPLPSSLNVHDQLWFEPLPAAHLVYCQCNAIADTKDESFSAFFHRLTAAVEATQVEYLVIDLRNNGGGNGALNPALIHEIIRCDRINRRGHLFVIIGRNTFSAAQNLTSALEQETAAVFVGEPSGSRPNFVGQSTMFTLPCSGLTVSCSSLYFQGAGISCDFRTWVEPDIVAEMSAEDAANNRDPAMEAILKEIAARPAGSTEP